MPIARQKMPRVLGSRDPLPHWYAAANDQAAGHIQLDLTVRQDMFSEQPVTAPHFTTRFLTRSSGNKSWPSPSPGAVEECFQAATDQCGLDHYQVRKSYSRSPRSPSSAETRCQACAGARATRVSTRRRRPSRSARFAGPAPRERRTADGPRRMPGTDRLGHRQRPRLPTRSPLRHPGSERSSSQRASASSAQAPAATCVCRAAHRLPAYRARAVAMASNGPNPTSVPMSSAMLRIASHRRRAIVRPSGRRHGFDTG